MAQLIAFHGAAGSGKSTAAAYLATRGWVEQGFAWPLKHLVGRLFDFSDAQLFGPSSERNRPDPRYPRPDGTCLTPREALQRFGTDAARACYPDIWVDAAMRHTRQLLAHGERVVLADLRFANEAQAILEAGVYVVKLHGQHTQLKGDAASHSSEAGIPDELVDLHVYNFGSKTKLYRLLDEMLATVGRLNGEA